MESRALYVERPAGHAGRAAIGRFFGLLALAAIGVSGAMASPVAPENPAKPIARAVVEQVQWSVWVESAGRRTPVAAGQPSGRAGGRFTATIVGALTRARAEGVAASL